MKRQIAKVIEHIQWVKTATGFIMYHPEGYMSAQMMSPGRPKYAGGGLHTGTQDEMAAAAEGYLAYCWTI